MRQSVAEREPWSWPSADEAQVEDGTKAREIPKASIFVDFRLSGIRVG